METEIVETKVFTPSTGLGTFEADQLLQQWGRNELEEHHKSHVRIDLDLILYFINQLSPCCCMFVSISFKSYLISKGSLCL